MNCLCCNESLKPEEKAQGWHARCVKKFFGTEVLPELDLSKTGIRQIADSNLIKGLAIPGVQKKLSLNLSKERDSSRLTLIDYPTGFILKPETKEYRYLPEFEHLAMSLAGVAGIQTAPHALIKVKNEYAYITKRLDRRFEGLRSTRLAMEDFCQLSLKMTEEKYKGSYEACGRIISEHSIYSRLDIVELFIEVVFAFMIGNSDLHLKNLSLIETTPKNREFRLSPAYDILPVRVILPEDNEQMALTVNGKKNRLTRQDFLQLGLRLGLTEGQMSKIIAGLCDRFNQYETICMESVLPSHESAKVIAYLKKSIAILLETG